MTDQVDWNELVESVPDLMGEAANSFELFLDQCPAVQDTLSSVELYYKDGKRLIELLYKLGYATGHIQASVAGKTKDIAVLTVESDFGGLFVMPKGKKAPSPLALQVFQEQEQEDGRD